MYILNRYCTRFENRPQDLFERAGEACLRPGRAAFGYWSASPKTVEKVQFCAGYVFLFLLCLPITLPLSIAGLVFLTFSHSHANHDRALREGLCELNYPWEHSDLHYQLAGTERDVIESWSGTTLLYPDGHTEIVDISFPLARLDGYQPQIDVEALTSFYQADIEEIQQIEMECFGVTSILNRFDRGYGYIAARDDENHIVGVLEYNGGLITSLGRKSTHARLGIGRRLIEAFKKSVSGPYSLQVRESNAGARHLYEQMGFQYVSRLPFYYSLPDEDGIYMVSPE
jgi:ribosomal protein S18 acetylase RimI-like enzyme